MRFDVITIFPDIIKPFVNESILKRAQSKGKVKIQVHDLRDYTDDKHRKVDDRPFGGGPGMVMTCQPIFDAVKKIKGRRKVKVILMSPGGVPLSQKISRRLAKEKKDIILLCGHYEGIDERVREKLVDETISIGDYVLTGGELPALVLVDSVTRLIPGVLGREESLIHESFENNLLDFPQYTRPANFRGAKVPNVLISGHHADIEKWRHEQSLLLTKKFRPDLIEKNND